MPSQEELAHQRNKDVATIEALRRNRSDLSKPHLLEHHFNAYAEAAASQLVTKAISLGYNCEGIDKDEHEGTPYWYFDLVKITIPSLETITRETTLMLRLAEEYDVDYDGWGTLVVE